MSWVKIEDRYGRHPKLMKAGPLALALDVCGMCYSREHGTDGFVPDHMLGLLGPVKRPEKVALLLVKANRWERDDELGGFWIHDFLEYNPSDEADREAADARSAKASRAARSRWDKKLGATIEQCSDDAQSNAASMMLPMPPSLPLPTQPPRASFDADFELWWIGWPKKLEKAEAKKKYCARRKTGITHTDLCTARDKYLGQLRDPEYCKNGATFLGPDTWLEYFTFEPAPNGRNGRTDFNRFS